MNRKHLKYACAVAVFSFLIYFRLFILAAAVIFAAFFQSDRSIEHVEIPTQPEEGADDIDTLEALTIRAPVDPGSDQQSVEESSPTSGGRQKLDETGTHWDAIIDDLAKTTSDDEVSHAESKSLEQSSDIRSQENRSDGKSNPRQVYVGGLPFRCMEDSIKDFFSERCGPLEYVKLLRQQGGKSKGVAFITLSQL